MRKLLIFGVLVLAGCGVEHPAVVTQTPPVETVVLTPFEQDLQTGGVEVNADTKELGTSICRWFRQGFTADEIMTTGLDVGIDPHLLAVVAESATKNHCSQHHDELVQWALDNA